MSDRISIVPENKITVTQTEYEQLLEKIRVLQARIIELTALRDDLLYHICPALRAEYEQKIGSLERELFAAQIQVLELKRILELLQAQMNRREKPSMEEAREDARKEYQEYEEDLKRRSKEAEDFREHWENESQWSRYDREEKQAEEKETDSDGEADFDSEDRVQEDEQGKNKKSAVSELKSLYRKIVKRLHPDVHPDATEKEKELLNRANEAYQRGDLEALREIWEALSGTEGAEEKFENSAEGLKKLRQRLRELEKRLEMLQREIDRIRSEFPYTMKELLENEKEVSEKRAGLQEQLRQTRETIRQLVDYIEQLKEQMS